MSGPSPARPGRFRLGHIRPGRLGAALAALAAFAAFAVLAGPAAAAEPAEASARRMGAGVNILGYDGVWEGGTDAPFRDRYFGMIARAGFRHVRINLHAFAYIDAGGRLDPALLERLDRVLERTVAAGLIPVIDEHDFDVCQTDAATCRTKLRVFWSAVSARYAGRYREAVFEILNEPGGNMSLATWNDILAEMLGIIRRTNPDRTVVVAALNTEAPLAERLPRLPEADRNLILTVHYYQPMTFTHQGAAWAPEFRSDKPVDWGSPDDRARMTRDFEAVAAWAAEARRPVYLGEFGVYDAAPAAARARWLGHAAATARRLGWPFAVWQFDHDFALYDTDRERWNAPVLRALMPEARPAGR
jgi:endoglucanase